MNKEIRELLRVAEAKGLVVKSGSNHVKVYGDDGLVCVLPYGSHLNSRNMRQAEIAIRKASA